MLPLITLFFYVKIERLIDVDIYQSSITVNGALKWIKSTFFRIWKIAKITIVNIYFSQTEAFLDDSGKFTW